MVEVKLQAEFQVVKIYDSILEETKQDIIFIRKGRKFRGALFFELDDWETVTEVLRLLKVTADSEEELAKKAITFYCEYAQTTYESTERTMRHWQYINGFTSHIFPIGGAQVG